tara:strand:+ start:143 stop:613 length:471 start_codon:yes stop_codon:yes gene_type:complete
MNRKTQYKKIDQVIDQEINKLIDNGYQQAALGTININGQPFVSKVTPMLFEGSVYLLISDLSEHARNITVNANVSIYFAAAEKNKTRSNNPRLSLQGKIFKLSLDKNDSFFKNLVSRHSLIDIGSEFWSNFDDFNFYKFEERRKLYVYGFGSAYEG